MIRNDVNGKVEDNIELKINMDEDEELIRYLSLLPLGEAQREPDSIHFGYATKSKLIDMFEDIGVTEPEGEFRTDICYSAVKELFNTPVSEEGGFPTGIEHLIRALCDRGRHLGKLDDAIRALNKKLASRYVYLTPDEYGIIQFHYGCVYDPNDELSIEAEGQIREFERSLRALIKIRLRRQFGASWEKSSGVTEERLEKWQNKREKSEIKNELIDYSDFYDLQTIVNKHWSEFKSCFSDKKRFDVLFEELLSFRNPVKHSQTLNRERLMFGIGIAADLISRIRRALREL